MTVCPMPHPNSMGTPSTHDVSTQVEAAVRNGTHYCDIAGEVHFVRKTTSTLHTAATEKGVKIVHACGFDSIPSDLGTLLLVEHMQKKLQRQCARVDLLVNEVKGAQSGSSWHSLFQQYMLPDEEIELCDDPFCLNPPDKKKAESKPHAAETDQFGMRYNKHLQCWTYPFQFAPINSRIVRRSNAFLQYSPAFRCAPSALRHLIITHQQAHHQNWLS